MIRVIVYQEAFAGFYSYRIDGHWGPDGAPLIGIAEDPLVEACRVLRALGVNPRAAIGLVNRHGRLEVSTTLRIVLAQTEPRVKALPAPRRRPRKRVPQVRGSGVPGDF